MIAAAMWLGTSGGTAARNALTYQIINAVICYKFEYPGVFYIHVRISIVTCT